MRSEFTAKTKVLAFERSKGFCECCTAKLFTGNIEYDHEIPDALGGQATIENCRVLCRACHGAKTTKADMPRISKAKRNYKSSHGIKRDRTILAWRNFKGEIVRASRSR